MLKKIEQCTLQKTKVTDSTFLEKKYNENSFSCCEDIDQIVKSKFLTKKSPISVLASSPTFAHSMDRSSRSMQRIFKSFVSPKRKSQQHSFSSKITVFEAIFPDVMCHKLSAPLQKFHDFVNIVTATRVSNVCFLQRTPLDFL